jgi:DMSO/TMAO reductase YedYZ molybdopterin-dependent catalytic subunit
LADLLSEARPKTDAKFVDANGADVGVAKTPDFVRSVAIRKATLPDTLVALEMNGVPLPDIHGAPARLIVPGWNGANWVKWVTQLTLNAEANSGFYMNPGYRYPTVAVSPGSPVRPEDLVTLETMPVKSFFVSPEDGTKCSRGGTVLSGIAWAGEQRIAKVDVSADRGASWHSAKLSKEDFPSAWRLWRFDWEPKSLGYHLLMCRATDQSGAKQPIEAAWNPSGYLWNSVDRLGVMVEG